MSTLGCSTLELRQQGRRKSSMTLAVVAVGLQDLSDHGVELIFDLTHSGLHGKLAVMNIGLKLGNSFSLLLFLL